MRKESAGVTEALLKSAQLEFLTHGFHDASLRRISAGSGVSTNSIYTRFGDKEGLFEAIVKPAADGLMDIYMHSVNDLKYKILPETAFLCQFFPLTTYFSENNFRLKLL